MLPDTSAFARRWFFACFGGKPTMILNMFFKIRSWSWGESLNRRIDRRDCACFKLQIQVSINLDEAFGRTEADEEIKFIARKSRTQFSLTSFSFRSYNFDRAVVDAKLASKLFG
jgi:hypothetical protein